MYMKVILWIEELGRGCFKPEHLIEMAQDMDLDANDLIDAKTGLYTFLCTHTHTHRRIGQAKREEVQAEMRF